MRKDRTIKKLERQVQELEGKLEGEQARTRGGAGAPSEEVAEARASEKRAWDQVDQLKAALGEAGMVWLGDVAAPAGALGEASYGGCGPAERKGGSPPHTPPRQDKEVGPSHAARKAPPAARDREELNPMDLDMILLKDRISELNTIAGDGVGSVGDGPRKERVIKMRQPAHLVLFKDGLKLHDNPFCSYADAEAVRTLKDVYDGYFPKALQKSFPEGVPIKLEDRRRESYRATTVGSRPLSNVKGFASIGDGIPAPQSKKELLGKLPQSVIRNGKIIEVRSGVSAAMGTTSPDKALVNTAVDSLLSQSTRFSMGPSCRAPPSTNTAGDGLSSGGGAVEVTTLQVKSEDGSETYVLRLKYEDTIGDVRLALNRHRRAPAGREVPAAKYEIQSGFPPRTFGDTHETLRDAGLVPNATLFLRGPSLERR